MTINGPVYSRGSGVQTVYARNSLQNKSLGTISNKMMGDIYTPDEGGRMSVRVSGGTGNTTLVTGVSGYQIEVESYTLVASGATGLSFLSNANVISGPMSLAANAVLVQQQSFLRTNAGESLILNLTASAVTGDLSYRLV